MELFLHDNGFEVILHLFTVVDYSWLFVVFSLNAVDKGSILNDIQQ